MEPINEIRDDNRLQTLYDINQLLHQVEKEGLGIDIVLPHVLDIAVSQLRAEDGSIIVVNNETLTVEHAWLRDQSAASMFNLRLEDIVQRGLAGWVLQNKTAVLVEDTAVDPRWHPINQATFESWTVLCAPLLVQGRAIGSITLHRTSSRPFSQSDLSLLVFIADQAATTIEHANLYERSRQQTRIASLLNEASSVINASLDLTEIMQRLLAQMNGFLNAEAISIALVDEQSHELVYEAAEGIGADRIVGLRLPSNAGLSGWVMEHAQPALVTDTSSDPRFKNRQGDKRTGHATEQMICAPVIFKSNVLGTIQAINRTEGQFTSEDLNVLVSLANIASSAVANAQQYARTQLAEMRYTTLFQDSIDPIVLTDTNGRILEANQRAVESFGYAQTELIGMSIYDLHAEADDIPALESITPDIVGVFESRIRPKNAPQPLYFRVHVKHISTAASPLLQWINHDITKQVELEEIRQDLTAMLVHDLQSPLGNVISSLELIRYEVPEDASDTMRSMLDIAVRSSHHLQTLVQSLLDISRLEAGHPIAKQTVVNVRSLVDLVYDIEEPSFDKRGVAFVNAIADGVPDVYIEESMIRRVLLNLLDNALKYSENNKCVIVDARAVDGDMVLFSVADQGQGIPESYREMIFEKFQRIKPRGSSKGLGLGLAFCRLAVEAHGGKIWVDDTPGGGARFNFTMPVATETAVLDEE